MSDFALELSSRALVSIKQARSYAFRNQDDSSRDPILIEAVNFVSSSIWDHCEREFTEASGTPTRSFLLRRRVVNGASVGWIDLAPYDLRSATTVKLFTDQAVASQQTLATDEYRLRPVGGAKGGTYLEILTVEPTAGEAQLGFEWEAQVTGAWGMGEVPETVQLACLQWVKNIVENPGSYASAAAQGFVIAPELDLGVVARAGMPVAVRHRLQPFCRSI